MKQVRHMVNLANYYLQKLYWIRSLNFSHLDNMKYTGKEKLPNLYYFTLLDENPRTPHWTFTAMFLLARFRTGRLYFGIA